MNKLQIYGIALGAANGALVAARIDFLAFKAWKDWSDILAYDWRIATFRWFQGAVIGAAAGLSGVSALQHLEAI
jgi:hypothetical protein